jgi:hypothetical protein
MKMKYKIQDKVDEIIGNIDGFDDVLETINAIYPVLEEKIMDLLWLEAEELVLNDNYVDIIKDEQEVLKC